MVAFWGGWVAFAAAFGRSATSAAKLGTEFLCNELQYERWAGFLCGEVRSVRDHCGKIRAVCGLHGYARAWVLMGRICGDFGDATGLLKNTWLDRKRSLLLLLLFYVTESKTLGGTVLVGFRPLYWLNWDDICDDYAYGCSGENTSLLKYKNIITLQKNEITQHVCTKY